MKVETRQKIERQIARRAAKDLIAAGYKVAVFDGEGRQVAGHPGLRPLALPGASAGDAFR